MPDTRQYDAGSPGVGKTHLCVGLGIRAVEQGFSVQYFRFDELMTALKIDAGLPPARLKRRKYMSTALLLIDELGFEPMTRPGGEPVLPAGHLPLRPRRDPDHDEQERAGLDRAFGRGRGAGGRDPGSAAAPGARAEHQGPQLSSSGSRRRPQAVPRLSIPQASRPTRARADSCGPRARFGLTRCLVNLGVAVARKSGCRLTDVV